MSIGPALERSMKITVFADLSCPWTYVGALELRAALAACGNLDIVFDVEYRPFWVESLEVLPEGTQMERAEVCQRRTGKRDVARRFRACTQRASQLGVKL
jgi:predicted DsbA family dithiol-disulfide isomerase